MLFVVRSSLQQISFGGISRLSLLRAEAREKADLDNDRDDIMDADTPLNPKVTPAQLKAYKEMLHAKYTGTN
jgi:hypothetical protein